MMTATITEPATKTEHHRSPDLQLLDVVGLGNAT